LALAQKLNLLFANADETMYRESIAYDLGSYQQPSREALSTSQDVTVAGVVAEEEKSITEDNQENDIERLQLIKDAQRRFEHRCRTYADIFVQESDSDNENEEKSDSDASSSTDSDSPYGSDSESSSSYDEYHAERKIPKKKIHRHHKGPIKLYFEERIGNWPKFRFKKYKRDHMKKHGIQINYGNIQTKEIKHSVKQEKRQRKNEDAYPANVSIMMEDFAKQTPSLLLDPKYPIVPIELDKSAYKSSKNEQIETKSTSTFHKMKLKIKKSFKKKMSQLIIHVRMTVMMNRWLQTVMLLVVPVTIMNSKNRINH